MIKSIFAVDPWGGMGNNGTLPWPHHKEDMMHFKEMTKGHVVVMGRNTWDDPKMPKPLPDRITYVVTNRPWSVKDAKTITGDFRAELRKLEERYSDKTIWIIGGPKLLEEARDLIEEAHITHFKGQYKNDAKINLRDFLVSFRCWSAKPSTTRDCNWSIYRNVDIFKPVV
jgi:dihydrofolate reductase